MTAPDRTTWTVAEDGWGDPTIWTDGDHAVAARWGDRISIDPAFTEQVWQVLTAVLAPDEATIERLARDLHKRMLPGCPCKHTEPVPPGGDIEVVRAVLAALAGTSAQARHTDGDEAGGGEHG